MQKGRRLRAPNLRIYFSNFEFTFAKKQNGSEEKHRQQPEGLSCRSSTRNFPKMTTFFSTFARN